jgi:hypothetical protein
MDTIVRRPAQVARSAQASNGVSIPAKPVAPVVAVWGSAISAFSATAPAILLISTMCMAGPAIACLLASVAFGLDGHARASGPLATWEGTNSLQNRQNAAPIALLFLQAGMVAAGFAFARGVIAWLTANAPSDGQTLGAGALRLQQGEVSGADSKGLVAACREARARFPGLLAGSLIYGACVTAGAVGISAALRDAGLDLRHAGRRDVSAPARALALRTLDALVLSPGTPLVEFVPALRQIDLTQRTHQPVDHLYWQEVAPAARGSATVLTTGVARQDDVVPLQGFLIGLLSIGLLVLAEALLRFIPVMAMCSDRRQRSNALAPALRSIGFGLLHFGKIMKHPWLLRLAFVAAHSLFFTLPIVLMEDVLPPVATNPISAFTGNGSMTLILACYWLVAALFVGFSTVYDACLYAALRGRPGV